MRVIAPIGNINLYSDKQEDKQEFKKLPKDKEY